MELDRDGPVITARGAPMMSAKFRLAQVVHPKVVIRQRLLDLISEGTAGPFTVVSAPAGAGKTVLLSSWVESGLSPGSVTSITLSEQDDDPVVFWSYVLEGLTRSGLPLPVSGSPPAAGELDHSMLTRLAACLSEQPKPYVLILDRAEVLTRPEVLDGLDFVMGYAAPQLRVVFATRVDPGLPLHRYRLAGAVVEIRADDLAFTLPEAQQLLAGHDINLSDKATAVLTDRTRGWAAGLRLAAMSIQHRADGDEIIDRFGGDRSDVAEYLLAEVLDAQTPAVRDFLLRTSLVDALWPGLAEELSDRRDAGRVLATLAHANAFVDRSDGGAIRYHPLFRQLLRTQLAYEAPGDVAGLHGRAARWLADAGHVHDAVRHATAAREWAYAASILVGHAALHGLLAGPDRDGLAALFCGMPNDVLGADAAVVSAALSLARSDPEAAGKHLARAYEYVDNDDPRHTTATHLAIAAVELVVAESRADVTAALPAAAEAEARADELAAAGTAVPAALLALVRARRGAILLWAGDLASAASMVTAGLQAADLADADHLRLECLSHMALIEALRGRSRRAADAARAAVALADRCGLDHRDRPASPDVALAWTYAEACDLAAARSHADRAAAGSTRAPVAAAALGLVRARMLRLRGDPAGAVAVLVETLRTAPAVPVPRWLRARLVAAEETLHLAGDQHDRAVQALEESEYADHPATQVALGAARLTRGDLAAAGAAAAQVLAQDTLPLDIRVEAWLLRASCALEGGRLQAAGNALDQALRLAKPEHLRRPVIEAPSQLRRFLRQNEDLSARHAWLGAAVVTPHTDHRDGAAAPVIVEALTEREREVLRYLAALLSTDEIARTMFVSVNTVKTHVRGILRKLCAGRRNEAIRRARELGLI